jgi:hypothetical protein
MGNLYSFYSSKPLCQKICDDYVGDKCFYMHIKVHSEDTFNISEISEYLQYLKPISISTMDKTIILHINGADLRTRSDISGEIIGSISTDITKYCIINSICIPYYVEVSIYIT